MIPKPADTGDVSGFTAAERSLGETLVKRGHLDDNAMARAEKLRESGSGNLPKILAGLGLVKETDLASALAAEVGAPLVAEADMPPAPVLENEVSGKFLRRSGMLPLEDRPDRLVLAVCDPFDRKSIDAVRLAVGKPIDLAISTPSEISRTVARLYFPEPHDEYPDMHLAGLDSGIGDDIERLKGLASEAPVIRMVNGYLDLAVECRASDIHFEPEETRLVVRVRIDGQLQEHDTPPVSMAAAIVSRIKIMARLDIAERRMPQDGRFRTVVRGRPVDLRVSTMPTIHGESVVIRVLDRDGVQLDFETLGITGESRDALNAMLDRPNGIILVTGPTGSGKTTTLYAALSQLNTPEKNILTVEDPIEYRLKGIKQVQVNATIGLDFSRVLRSVLRHDPDIILIGEIRDRETAEIAVQAALTGHLVLSTLHTNDAASAIARLLDMQIADYLIASSLIGVVAQRLVRTLCTKCRRLEPVPVEYLEQSNTLGGRFGHGDVHHRATGCPHCRMSGYQGRICITEALAVTHPLRRLVLANADDVALRRAAQKQGMRTMFEDGMEKVASGATTLEEVMRVTIDH